MNALSPFIYIFENEGKIEKDISLKAICQLCTDPDLIYDVNHKDKQLSYLAHLFNQLIDSDRILLMCYDCGTVARGVFFQLVNAYRGQFLIRNDEIERIKDEYYMNKYPTDVSLSIFRNNTQKIKKNCIYMCALQFGEKFGHIYIIEKVYIKEKPRYRIYQSCHQSYLLIDYIEHMNYANNIMSGIDIDDHINDLSHLLLTEKWGQKEIDLFIKWFHFYPMGRILSSDVKRLATTYIIC